jgi:peptidoglycan/LPS O-acetylase OafA/YrhL
LWHLPVLVALRYPPLDRVPVALGIVAATVLASLSYYGVEQPALRLKRYFQPVANSG